MGWAAVRNDLASPAWTIFGIVFFWQFPHTWSIASRYKDDFSRAGYRVLPLVDPEGRRTRDQVISLSIVLALVSLLPAVLGVVGPVYAVGAVLAGVVFNGCAIRYGFGRTRRHSGQLMAASLIYMPVILALLLVDRRVI
jgi:protoheme IX farnesyltransferase